VRQARGLKLRRFSLSWQGGLWLMLAPYLIGTLVLVGLPALMSAGLAFTSYDALSPPVYVGLANFRLLAADPLVTTSLLNSLFFVALAVPLRILGALGLAMLLSRPRRGGGAYRAGVYVPTVIPDVAFALIWLWIFNPLFGPVNLALDALGLPLPGWLADSETARFPFVIMSLFQIGEGFVVLLAALRGLPREYFDAGAVDGAGRWTSFRYLTFPLLLPWLVLLTFRDVILTFQYTFTPSLVMTGGDPYYSTLFLPLLIFEEAFDRFRFGPGSALMVLMFAASAAIIVGVYLVFRKRGYTGDV
jgi:multiple sugar transport system permease protein